MFMPEDCLDWEDNLVCCFKLAIDLVREFIDYAD